MNPGSESGWDTVTKYVEITLEDGTTDIILIGNGEGMDTGDPDGDGIMGEDWVNGYDDDGDGLIDEDFLKQMELIMMEMVL